MGEEKGQEVRSSVGHSLKQVLWRRRRARSRAELAPVTMGRAQEPRGRSPAPGQNRGQEKHLPTLHSHWRLPETATHAARRNCEQTGHNFR